MKELGLKFAYCLGTYFVAGIPFGLIFAKAFKKVDVRKVGSGNIGATNVLRSAGLGPALLTALADISKSLIPVLVARSIFKNTLFPEIVWITAVLGHCFSPYLKFKGGKGVATFYGGLIALNLKLALVSFLIWVIVIIPTGFVSLGSMVSVLIPPISFALAGKWNQTFVFLIPAIIIIIRHKDNIKRLLEGRENRFKILKR